MYNVSMVGGECVPRLSRKVACPLLAVHRYPGLSFDSNLHPGSLIAMKNIPETTAPLMCHISPIHS